MILLTGSVGKGGQNRPHDVAVIQAALSFIGVNPGPFDGRYGPKTEAGLTAYCSSQGFPPHSQIGPNQPTLHRLTTLVRQKFPHWQVFSALPDTKQIYAGKLGEHQIRAQLDGMKRTMVPLRERADILSFARSISSELKVAYLIRGEQPGHDGRIRVDLGFEGVDWFDGTRLRSGPHPATPFLLPGLPQAVCTYLRTRASRTLREMQWRDGFNYNLVTRQIIKALVGAPKPSAMFLDGFGRGLSQTDAKSSLPYLGGLENILRSGAYLKPEGKRMALEVMEYLRDADPDSLTNRRLKIVSYAIEQGEQMIIEDLSVRLSATKEDVSWLVELFGPLLDYVSEELRKNQDKHERKSQISSGGVRG